MPSLCSFIGLTVQPSSYIYDSPPHAAILVCLEHSFWIVQQCSNPTDGFIKAWDIYLKTRRALVDREVDNYLRSKDGGDWFIFKHRASEEECAEFKDIVLNNLLCKPSGPSFNEAELLICLQLVLKCPLDHLRSGACQVNHKLAAIFFVLTSSHF